MRRAVLAIMCIAAAGCCDQAIVARRDQPSQDATEVEAAIRSMCALPYPRTPSAGGPYGGVEPNEVTERIISYGTRSISGLRAVLRASEEPSAVVYAVYCLRKLKAREALDDVRALIHDIGLERRFHGKVFDLTVLTQAELFVEKSKGW